MFKALVNLSKVLLTKTAQILARSLANLLSSINGQTHGFIIYAMRQRARADNLTICYRKKTKQIGVVCGATLKML